MAKDRKMPVPPEPKLAVTFGRGSFNGEEVRRNAPRRSAAPLRERGRNGRHNRRRRRTNKSTQAHFDGAVGVFQMHVSIRNGGVSDQPRRD